MNRDMNLVRAVLRSAVDCPHGIIGENPKIEGYDDECIAYHVYLMAQAGLVKAANVTFGESRSPQALLDEITWAGYDFADAAADDAIWKKASVTVLRHGASFTFDLLKEWLKAEAKTKLGLS